MVAVDFERGRLSKSSLKNRRQKPATIVNMCNKVNKFSKEENQQMNPQARVRDPSFDRSTVRAHAADCSATPAVQRSSRQPQTANRAKRPELQVTN